MADVRAEEAPVHESWDVRFTVNETPFDSHDTRPRLAIEAGYLAAYERGDSSYTLLRSYPEDAGEPVTAYLFDAGGDTSAVVTANRMLYFDQEQRFEARGRVVVVTREGRRLETEELYWYEDRREVRTPGFTRITTPKERIQGYGLVADEDLENYTLARVTGQVTVEEE